MLVMFYSAIRRRLSIISVVWSVSQHKM